ncbi:hypothetical protein [Xanthobacter versatilis]|uniref:hypothetical protein n=1 Tax=Xanthobacter autotrophicus (strain ATCC BAA-1158 / Py2) TaxID=78245 RepID=UPI0037275886
MPGLLSHISPADLTAIETKTRTLLATLAPLEPLAELIAAAPRFDAAPRLDAFLAANLTVGERDIATAWLAKTGAIEAPTAEVGASSDPPLATLDVAILPIEAAGAVDLTQPAPVAVVLVLGSPIHPESADQTRIAARLHDGARLILVAFDAVDAELLDSMRQWVDLHLLVGAGALAQTSLDAALRRTTCVEDEALRREGRALTAHRAMRLARQGIEAAITACEAEQVVQRHDQTPAGADETVSLTSAWEAERGPIEAVLRKIFSTAESAYPIDEIDMVIDLDTGTQPTTHYTVTSTLHTKHQEALAEDLADKLAVALDYLSGRVAALDARVDQLIDARKESGLLTPPPRLNAAALKAEIAQIVTTMRPPEDARPRKTIAGAITRNNPAALATPLLPIGAALAALVGGEHATQIAQSGRQKMMLVIATVGALAFVYSVLTAGPRLNKERRIEKAEVRDRLETAGGLARARLIDEATNAVLTASAHYMNSVRTWLTDGLATLQANRTPRAAPDLQTAEANLRRELYQRLKILHEHVQTYGGRP